MEYLDARQRVGSYLRHFYEGAYFRSRKYSVYLATKASKDKLVDKLRDTFGSGGRAIVIFWGNWGRHPNALRNGPPTPGIGLRRFIHRRLASDRRHGQVFNGTTLTTFEGGTSSVCNACGERVQNVKGVDGQLQYRLLRCSGCGRMAFTGIGMTSGAGTS